MKRIVIAIFIVGMILAVAAEPAQTQTDVSIAAIVFQSNRDGETQLYLMDADGGNVNALGVIGQDPSWSPDGSMIAYESPDNELAILDLETRETTVIFDSEHELYGVAWSPVIGDGRIVFVTDHFEKDSFHIYTYDPALDDVVQLTNEPARYGRPDWSPQATQIVYNREGDIYILEINSQVERQVTRSVDIDTDPAWSPDGERIAFHASIDNTVNLFLVDADGGNFTQLTNTGGRNPAWSPSGEVLVYFYESQILRITIDGEAIQRLTLDGAFPDWRPVPFDGTIDTGKFRTVDVTIDQITVTAPNLSRIIGTEIETLENCNGTAELSIDKTFEREETRIATFAEGKITETCNSEELGGALSLEIDPTGISSRSGFEFFNIEPSIWYVTRNDICEVFSEELGFTEGTVVTQSETVTLRAAPGTSTSYEVVWSFVEQGGVIELVIDGENVSLPFVLSDRLDVTVRASEQNECG